MGKQKVSKSQIIAAALLVGFDNISDFELDLFIEMFLKSNPNYELSKNYITDIAKFISIKDGKISLWEKDATNELKDIAGIVMIFFDNFDYEEFLIRKIWKLGCYTENNVNKLFSKVEQENLKKLKNDGYINMTYSEDIPHNDYKKYVFSTKGYAKYFKLVYEEEFREFTNKLMSLGYDVSLLDDYLMTINYTNLERETELADITMLGKILDIDALDEFCSYYDRAKYVDEATAACFKK